MGYIAILLLYINITRLKQKHVKKEPKKGLTKLVRINDRTEIEVSVDIPDDVARKNWLEKVNENISKFRSPNLKQPKS